MKTPFEILEIPHGSPVDVAKKAYRRLAHIHHPDKAGGTTAKFVEIKNAFEAIEKGNIPSREPFVYRPRATYTSWQYQQQQSSYESVIEKQEAMRKAMEEFKRKTDEIGKRYQDLMNQQFSETTAEWRKRMLDNMNP